MDTMELKNKLLDVSRILQNAQNNPQPEDIIKALQTLNEVIFSLEGVCS